MYLDENLMFSTVNNILSQWKELAPKVQAQPSLDVSIYKLCINMFCYNKHFLAASSGIVPDIWQYYYTRLIIQKW